MQLRLHTLQGILSFNTTWKSLILREFCFTLYVIVKAVQYTPTGSFALPKLRLLY